jgi:eukaryotic-like serine/threonine-protein kinase
VGFRRRDPDPPPDDEDVTRVVRRDGAPVEPDEDVTRVERADRWPDDPVVEEEVVREPVVEERVEEVERVGPPRRRPPTLWPWLLLLLLLVVGGLAAYWFLARGEDETTVPRAVGLREAAAVERVRDAGLEPVVSRRPSSRPEGVVFAQRPGAGSRLEDDEAVDLLVSTGPSTVVLPNVVGLRVQQALERLREPRDADFDVRQRRVFSEEPTGVVVAQDPGAGNRVPVDATVRINVSKGTGRVEVPDVVGSTVDEATAELRRRGLTAKAFDVPSSDPEGTVVAQNPPGGSQLAEGDSVRLNVSTGEAGDTTPTDTTTDTTGSGSAAVAVPSTVGRRLAAAQRALQDAGFTVVVAYVASARPAGIVLRQTPAGGTSARRGSSVALDVSQGPAQTTRAIPDVVGLPRADAVAELRDAGFRVQVFTEPTPDEAEDGLVVRQEPGAGRRAARGSAVTLYVGDFSP